MKGDLKLYGNQLHYFTTYVKQVSWGVLTCYLVGNSASRILPQTGGKHYGVHQGPYNIPAEEDNPRLDLGRNFYYRQEDILTELGAKYRFDSSITRPMIITGVLKGNYLNLSIALGFYLAVTKELGDTPVFNGMSTKYHSTEGLSSSAMNAYFAEWCALKPATQFSDQPLRLFKAQFSIKRPVYGDEPANLELRNSYASWAKEERTIEAWKRLAKR